MNRSQFRRSRVAAGVIAAASLLGAGHASGAAFALQEESASGLGNAFAGGAAAAEDASSMSVNPATLSKYSSAQVVLGVHFITPSMKFKNDGSQPAAFQPLGGDGGDAGSTNVVPNLYLAVPINRDLVFGLGINVPFGLVTEYDDDFIGRFQGLKSDVQTINVNPALSWKVNDQFAHRRRRQLAAHQGHVLANGQLLGRAGAGGDAGGGAGGDSAGARAGDRRRDPGLAVEIDRRRQRQRVGLERRHAVGCQSGDARGPVLSLADEVQGDGQRRLRQSDAERAGAAGAGGGPARATGELRRALQRRGQCQRQAARHRQPVDLPVDQRPLGLDGRRAVDRLVDVQGPDVRAHHG